MVKVWVDFVPDYQMPENRFVEGLKAASTLGI